MSLHTPSRLARRPVGLAAALLVASLALAARPAECRAAEPPDTLKLKTERVIAFKDGYCLTIKRGTAVTDERGEIHTTEVPDAAVLGSFWATSKGARIVSMTAGWTTAATKIERELPCVQHIDLLQANLGRTCKVVLADKTEYQGTIRQVLAEPTSAPVPPSLHELFGLAPAADDPVAGFLGTVPDGGSPTRQLALLSGLSGANFVLAAAEGDILLPVGQIKTLTIKDMQTTLKRTVTRAVRTKQLTFRLEKPKQREELLVMYFSPGLRWIPTYRIDLGTRGENKMATVRLQAEILNEHEDLADVPVDIVVGVPNFRFKGTVSPLALEQTLRQALAQAAPQLMNQMRNDLSNSAYQVRSTEFRREAAAATALADAGTLELPGELTATGAQDLFVYNLPALKLKKGDRTAVHIFSADVPYRDVYTWDLTVKRRDVDTAPSGSGIKSPLALSKNEVWHQIELMNNTKLPWTTGAAMIVQGQQPLAQELLTYTSPKDPARVPVTVSVETRGSFEEKETDRQLKALEWDGYHYARITKEARPDLCNNKPHAVEVEIRFRCGGRVTSATHDGEVTLSGFEAEDWDQYRGSPAVNNSSSVRWKVKLGPGETFRPVVRYDYYARH